MFNPKSSDDVKSITARVLPGKNSTVSPRPRTGSIFDALQDLSTYEKRKYYRVKAALAVNKDMQRLLTKKVNKYPWNESREIIRMLEYNGWKAKKAIPQLFEHLTWWGTKRPDKMAADGRFTKTIQNGVVYQSGISRYIGRDLDGRPTCICYPALHNPIRKTDVDDYMNFVIWTLERGLQLTDDTGMCSLIFDYAGYKLKTNFDRLFYSKGINLLKKQYSGFMGNLVLIDMPPALHNLFKIGHAVHGTTGQAEKLLHTIKAKHVTSSLCAVFPVHSIPLEYGGTRDCLSHHQRALLHRERRIVYANKVALPAFPCSYTVPADPYPENWECPLCCELNTMRDPTCSHCLGDRLEFRDDNIRSVGAIGRGSSSGSSVSMDATSYFDRSDCQTGPMIATFDDVFDGGLDVTTPLVAGVVNSVRMEVELGWKKTIDEVTVDVLLDQKVLDASHSFGSTSARLYRGRWGTGIPVAVRVFDFFPSKRRSVVKRRALMGQHATRVIKETASKCPYLLNLHGAWSADCKVKIPKDTEDKVEAAGDALAALPKGKRGSLYSATLYVVYDIVDCTLHDWLHGAMQSKSGVRSPPSWASRLKVASDVAAALKFLHSQKSPIRHSTLSSFSTFVRREEGGEVHGLVAFGFDLLLRQCSGDADDEYVPAHSRWMAPSDAENGTSSLESDVFAFGLILLELLTGDVPYSHVADAPAVLDCILRGGTNVLRLGAGQGWALIEGSISGEAWTVSEETKAKPQSTQPSVTSLSDAPLELCPLGAKCKQREDSDHALAFCRALGRPLPLVNERYCKLISSCLAADPACRPSFARILSKLSKIDPATEPPADFHVKCPLWPSDFGNQNDKKMHSRRGNGRAGRSPGKSARASPGKDSSPRKHSSSSKSPRNRRFSGKGKSPRKHSSSGKSPRRRTSARTAESPRNSGRPSGKKKTQGSPPSDELEPSYCEPATAQRALDLTISVSAPLYGDVASMPVGDRGSFHSTEPVRLVEKPTIEYGSESNLGWYGHSPVQRSHQYCSPPTKHGSDASLGTSSHTSVGGSHQYDGIDTLEGSEYGDPAPTHTMKTLCCSSDFSEDLENVGADDGHKPEDVLSSDTAMHTKQQLQKRLTDYGVRVLQASEVKVKDKIGSGSFGFVQRGNYKGMKVAVKTLRASNMSESTRAIFEHEAAIMAKVSHHPNIVSLIGILQTDSTLAFVTEFADGGSLDEFLEGYEVRGRRLEPSLALRLCCDIAYALDFVHSEGVVHRDIAARNVLLHGKDMRVLVTDFGMARLKQAGDVGETQSRVGPIRWMAPESINEQKYSPASDAWAYGVLVWEIFTCVRPWEGQTLMNVAMSVVRDKKTLPLDAISFEPLRELISVCWSYSPEDRPSMNTVFKKMKRYLKSV